MFVFVTPPSATDLIAQISPIASGLISDFSPYIALIIGAGFAMWFISWLVDKIGDVRQHSEIAHHLSRLSPEEQAAVFEELGHREAGVEEQAVLSESLADYKKHF